MTAARGPGLVVELSQTEVAEFKLDGLVLAIEGAGRTKSDGKLALQADRRDAGEVVMEISARYLLRGDKSGLV